MRRRRATVLALLVALCTPSAAHAHLVNSGLGPFYDGGLHLLLSPLDIVRLIALSLFAGAQTPRNAQIIVVAATLAWFLGAAVALGFDGTGNFAVANGVGLFLLGAVIALDLKPPASVAVTATSAFAGLQGFQNGIALRSGGAAWAELLGSTVVMFVLLLLVTALTIAATAFAARIVCRVLGSWAAATGLLSIGWVVATNR